jgi:ion channel-forming bestrophin family protein
MALQIRGSVIPTILPRVIVCSGVGIIAALIDSYGFSLPEEILGTVTSNVSYNLLLVFRTNTAYERYWEGRKVWGGIVINSLNLGRKIKLIVIENSPIERQNKIDAMRLLSAFAIATKLHLRSQPPNSELESLLTQSQYAQLKDIKNIPLKITFWIGEYLKKQQLNKRLTTDESIAISNNLDSMVEAIIGCDRIRKTPIPLAYAIYLKRLLLIYCFILPFQLVNELNWWAIPVVTLLSFILLGVEEIGNQIEDPFGSDDNDLPIEEICNTVVKNIEDLIALDS